MPTYVYFMNISLFYFNEIQVKNTENHGDF